MMRTEHKHVTACLAGFVGLALCALPTGGARNETATPAPSDDRVFQNGAGSYLRKVTVEGCLQSQGVGTGFYYGPESGNRGAAAFIAISELGNKTVTFTYHLASGRITTREWLDDRGAEVKDPSPVQRETLKAVRACANAATAAP
jgi:hypothetical protein